MKTKEEIEQLAENYADKYADYGNHKYGFIAGYVKCQEDMNKDVEYWQGEFDHWHQQAMECCGTDKKYTEDDIRKAIQIGVNAEAGDYPKGWSYKLGVTLEDFFINSLNKQD